MPVGVYPRKYRPLAERFWEKVDKTDGCWLWKASADQHGYGSLRIRPGKTLYKAHRLAYELIRGPIPDGLELDHLCRVHACVNPDHLEPVTHLENMRRSAAARKTHCPRGHPYSPENTIVHHPHPGWIKRACKTCVKANQRRRYRERRAAAA